MIGALGMVPKTGEVLQIPGAPLLTEFQKATLMGTAHILRNVLSMKFLLYLFIHLFFNLFIYFFMYLFIYFN